MKIKRRKLLSLVLVLALVFANFSGIEARAEGAEGHTHNWKYSIKENTTDTIVASCETITVESPSCETASCETALCETGEAQIVAKDTDYSGKEYAGAEVDYSGEFPDRNLQITYYQGDSEITPINAGEYEAKICKEGATATTNFKINKIEQNASVSMENYIFGDKLSEPKVSNMNETPSVKYYYDNTGEGLEVSTASKWENIDKETLQPGTYYMYAVLSETQNYKQTTLGPVKFEVLENDMSDIKVADIRTTYDGQEHTIITPSISDGAEIKYSLEKDGEYSVEVPTFTEAGTYTIYYIVKKTGYKSVEGSTEVIIAPANIESATIELNPGDTQKTGEEITQSITKVIVNGKELTKDRDYTIDEKSVLSATECGEYIITINGKGNYTGKGSVMWKITKSDEPTPPPTTPPTEQPTASPNVTPTLTPTPAPTAAPDMKILQSPVGAEGEYFAPIGKEVELQITVENADSKNLEYQWYMDGKKIDGNSSKLTVKLKKKGTVIYTCDIYNKVTKETKKMAGSWKVTGYNEKVSITYKKTKNIKDIFGKKVTLSEIKVPKKAKKALTVNAKNGTIKMKKYCKNVKVTLVTKEGQDIDIVVSTVYPKPVVKVKKGALKSYIEGKYRTFIFNAANVKGAKKVIIEYSRKKKSGFKKAPQNKFIIKKGDSWFIRVYAKYGKQNSPYSKVVKVKG